MTGGYSYCSRKDLQGDYQLIKIEMNMDDKIEQMALERAMLIDRELYTLLKTYDVPFEGRVDELRKTLKEKGFEIIQDINETPTATVYTLKICKLLGSRTLSIPKVVL